MNTTTLETVEVPRHVIDAVIGIYATAAQQGRDFHPEVADALRAVVDRDLPAGTQPGTIRIDAEHAWHLADVGEALDVYGLNEEDDDTWHHPAVTAQQALEQLVDEQAPHVATRLTAGLDAAAGNH